MEKKKSLAPPSSQTKKTRKIGNKILKFKKRKEKSKKNQKNVFAFHRQFECAERLNTAGASMAMTTSLLRSAPWKLSVLALFLFASAHYQFVNVFVDNNLSSEVQWESGQDLDGQVVVSRDVDGHVVQHGVEPDCRPCLSAHTG